jgi:hypothetical protein
MTAKPISIKLTGCKSGGCASLNALLAAVRGAIIEDPKDALG